MASEHGIELGTCENAMRAQLGARPIKVGPRLVALLAVSDSETRCMGLAICRWMIATTSMDLGDDKNLFQSAVVHNQQKGLRAHGLLVYSVEAAWCSDFLLSSAWSSLRTLSRRLFSARLRVDAVAGVFGGPVVTCGYSDVIAQASVACGAETEGEVYVWCESAETIRDITSGGMKWWSLPLNVAHRYMISKAYANMHFFGKSEIYFAPTKRQRAEAKKLLQPLQPLSLPMQPLSLLQPLSLPLQPSSLLLQTLSLPPQRIIPRGTGKCGIKGFSFDPWYIVDTVLFSRHLRSCSSLQQASQDNLALIFGDQGTVFAEQIITSGFKFLHKSWARRYRVRVDIATMLLHRHMGKTLIASTRLIGRVLMFDASRGFGREVLGMREDVVTFADGCDIPTVCSRRLVTSSLSHGHMSAADKGATLLGAAFRDHGPTKKQLGDWCDSVFVIPTDDGVESVVADSRNCLPLFFGLTATSRDPEFLFMNALRVSGWNHVCHGIVEECISSLSWYPSWISAFKDLCSILALPAYRDAFEKALVVSGNEDLLPLPSLCSFVESRFGLIVKCASDALKWKQILRSIASSVDVFSIWIRSFFACLSLRVPSVKSLKFFGSARISWSTFSHRLIRCAVGVMDAIATRKRGKKANNSSVRLLAGCLGRLIYRRRGHCMS
jgi:hypothetical protein